MFMGSSTALEDLLKKADMAMYQAKTAGRDTTCIFNPTMQ
jgi:PleD family two-component response regulator